MSRKQDGSGKEENLNQPVGDDQPAHREAAGKVEPEHPVTTGDSEHGPAPAQPATPAGEMGNAATQSGEAILQDSAETRSKLAFFGRSGHLAVMAEFLHRRINVAIPEVDVGDDIFVVKGVAVEVTRVQVKSATAKEQQNTYVALVNLPEDQLSVPSDNPPLVYIFPIRRKEGKQGRWYDFIVIRRGTLFDRYINQQAGKRYVEPKGKPYVQFRIVLTDTTALSGPGQVDFQNYRDAWDPWPPRWLTDEGTA